VQQLFGLSPSDDTIAGASPDTHVANGYPPTMLISGNKDELVPFRESIHMYDTLLGAKGRAELHLFEGAPHGFDAQPALGRQCASMMALFLDRTMVNPQPVAVPQAAG
jgi:dipeptidyl aminopeptidase/acylaminoacyl peptidase